MPAPNIGDLDWGLVLNNFLSTLEGAAQIDADVAAKVSTPGTATATAVATVAAAAATTAATTAANSAVASAVPGAVASALASLADDSVPISAVSGLQPALDDLEAGFSGVAHAGDALSTFTGQTSLAQAFPLAAFVVYYNFGTSTWPTRPTTRTDVGGFWLGPLTDPPDVGGTGMVDGKDIFLGVDG